MISSNLKLCIEDIETINFLGIVSDCSDDCFKKNIEIDIKNKKCIISNWKVGYKYKEKIFTQCENDTHYIYLVTKIFLIHITEC